MRSIIKIHAAAIAIVFMLVPGSCASVPAARNMNGSGALADAAANPAWLDGAVHFPLRQASAGKLPSSALGKDFLAGLGYSHCTGSGNAALFSPQWTGAKYPVLADAAYCVYGLGLDGALTSALLTTAWNGSLPEINKGWLGLSDVPQMRWDWRQLTANEYTLDDAHRYADAGGNVYVAVILLGTQPRTLDSISLTASNVLSYPVVDTAQDACFDIASEIAAPQEGDPFYGQDAQYTGHAPSYTLSQDGLTVHDNITGLTWMHSPDTDGDGQILAADKMTWSEMLVYPAALNASKFGGFDDWRLPTIKELYSLIDFRGTDPSGMPGNDTSALTPFVNRDYFVFDYGDTAAGERIIDSQYGSSTMYVNQSWHGFNMLFGINFADGRIKGYELMLPGGLEKTFTVLCVRGGSEYGINQFTDNGDGTVTDQATGLMWQQADNGEGLLWQDALSYAEGLDFAGYTDWRLPNAKELQSLLDYSNSPDSSGSAALAAVFSASLITNEAGADDYPCYWTSTTHINWSASPGSSGIYMAFGRAMGYMDGAWHDVHGAGAQRSDPKDGDPADYPFGRGPQGDAIRIFNYVRCVREAS